MTTQSSPEPLWEKLAPAVEALLHEVADDLLAQRDKEYPNEAVGLITDHARVWPLINQARSPKRFEVSSTLLTEAIHELGKYGEQAVATYHSHPATASGASARDSMLMQENPGSVHVIIGQDGIAAWMWLEQLRSVTRIPLPERNANVGVH